MRSGSSVAILAFTLSTTLVTMAAFVVPALFGRTGRVSRVLIASLAWNALIIGPIYALGLLERLYASTIAAAVIAISLLVFGYAYRSLGSARTFRAVCETAGTFLRLPYDAMRIAIGEGGFAMLVVPIALVVTVSLTAQAVLAPTWGDWDCLWYHEPMIGFAIQNHGFAMVPLEPFSQKINGYPRLTEMTMLYLGIFHGRWAVDLVNPLFLPLLTVGTYALCRDLGARRTTAVTFGASMVLLPGVARLVPTTMVDVHAASLLVAASYFACRREFSSVDAVLGIFAVTLAMGSKALAWVPGFCLCVTLLVRILRRRRSLGRAQTFSLIGFGVSATMGIVAFTAWRNYAHFHNPFWPDLRVDIPRFGIHWPGNFVYDDPGLPITEQVNADIPWTEFAKRLFALPFSVNNGHDWQIVDYGAGASFTLIPLGVLITLVASFQAALHLLVRRSGTEAQTRKTWGSILRLSIPLAVTVAVSPAPYVGRYHIAMLAIAAAILSGYAAHHGRHGFTEGLAAVLAIGSLQTVAWNNRGWIRTPTELAALLETPTPERYVREDLGSAIRRSTGLSRERDLGVGDVVVFERIAYLSLLWNDHYSNRVVWLEDAPDPLARARELDAVWIYASRGGWFDTHHAQMLDSGWELVGELETERFGKVYRRRSRPTGTPE